MKPWREVLAEKGWEREQLRCADSREQWRIGGWRLTMAPEESGWSPIAWCGLSCIFDLDNSYPTEDAAFVALMAKPIGPGRVTVGVLLGVTP